MKKCFIVLVLITIMILVCSCSSTPSEYKILSQENMQQLSSPDLVWLVDYCNHKANNALVNLSGIYWAQQAQVYQQEELLRVAK